MSEDGEDVDDLEPGLREVARTLDEGRVAAILVDARWQLRWVSPQLREVLGIADENALGVGEHLLVSLQRPMWRELRTEVSERDLFKRLAGYIAAGTSGGVEGLRELCAADDRPLLDTVEPCAPPPLWVLPFEILSEQDRRSVGVLGVSLREDGASSTGTALIFAPALPATVLALLTQGDEAMFSRMAGLTEPAQRPAAVLFADLDSSSVMSRELPTAGYFGLIQALTTAIDAVVAEHGGVVGKHAGDGATAFFLAEGAGSDSAAARAALATALRLPGTAHAVVADLGDSVALDPEQVKLNVGVHWGANLFLGQIITGGRLEVTALGDEVNECARLQQVASDGQVLASKTLVERLTDADAEALGLERESGRYRPLSELASDDKALRDAGHVPVVNLREVAP